VSKKKVKFKTTLRSEEGVLMSTAFWQAITRSIVLLICIGMLCAMLYMVVPLVYPFIIGFILALMFNPLVGWLHRRARFPRGLAVICTILLFIAILATVVTLAVIEITSEVQHFQLLVQANADEYIMAVELFVSEILAFYDSLTAFYSSLDEEVQRNISEYVENLSSGIVERASLALTGFMEGLVAFLRAVPLIAAAFVISLIASFFISKDWYKWRERVGKLIPDPVRKRGIAVIEDLRSAIFGFIKAQLTLISITFAIVLVGLWIMRVEYALTISLFVGLVDLIPYLGPGLIFIPWIVYLFFTGEYAMVLGLSILYALVVLQRQMMEPKILGDNVGLDPLTTLFALFVGFSLFGMFGLVIGPVIMVILGALHRAGVFREAWRFIKGENVKQ
jgi:sporulation integral membrane protein YtvI